MIVLRHFDSHCSLISHGSIYRMIRGFHKRMVVYRPLAEVFGIQEQRGMYWLYDNSTHFSVAFGDCLEYLAGNQIR